MEKKFPWVTVIAIICASVYIIYDKGFNEFFWMICVGIGIFFVFDCFDRVRRIEIKQKQILKILERLEEKNQ